GTARVTIRMASNKAAANLSVWLVELPYPAGTNGAMDPRGIVTRGWADPQNAKSLRAGEPLRAGEAVTLTFDLEPDDQIIPAGKRLGFMIFSSDKDFTLWPGAGTQLSVDLDGTTLVLPVVGGRAALARAVQ
ncbi:MAG: Xaa-Pro dipeptidyl-peptidase, partial [Gemmatimonadaceae bacterium]|nr:Xaa-Pro dipeptidyl-peptidase [Gemmatimonadaceae bacterium]